MSLGTLGGILALVRDGRGGGKSRGVKSFDFVILLLGIEDQNRGRASDMWLSLHFLRKLMFFTFTVLIRSTAMKT